MTLERERFVLGGCPSLYMTSSEINVPSQKFPVPKITMQTKSHNLNFNDLSSVMKFEYHLILIIISMSKHGLNKKSTHICPALFSPLFPQGTIVIGRTE